MAIALFCRATKKCAAKSRSISFPHQTLIVLHSKVQRSMSNKQPPIPKRPRNSKNMRLTVHDIPRPNTTQRATGDQFIYASRKLLQTIHDGVIHLEEANKGTRTPVSVEWLNTSQTSLSISIELLGSFKIECDDIRNEITVFSPVSYGQVYHYFAEDDEWKSELDGHNIIQLLAIEINANCQGYPKF